MKLNTKVLKEVEIGIPVVVAGPYHAVLHKVELKPNKKGDGHNLVIMTKVVDPEVTLFGPEGKVIQNRGNVVCSRHISLVATDKYDPDQNLKELALAIGHNVEEDLTLEIVSAFKGVLMVDLNVRPEETDDNGKKYPTQNEVRRYSPVPADDLFQRPPNL